MDFNKKAKQNEILEIRVGSHLFGTNTPESDLDLYGIFMPFNEIVYGSYRCEEVKENVISKDESGRNTKDAIDKTIVEYRKFINLALQNNPNILHVLFVNKENILYQDDLGFSKRLLDNAELFPHQGSHHRFVKYADSQRHKMRIKPENYFALEKGLEILDKFPDDNVLADVVNSSVQVFVDHGTGKHVSCGDLFIERGTFVKKARRVIKERLSKSTNRSAMFTKYGYDLKFSSNLIQLLMEGIELSKTGRIEFPLSYRQEILDVKSGKYTVDEILKWADELVEESRGAFNNTKLPKEPRTKEIELFAMNEVKKYLHWHRE